MALKIKYTYKILELSAVELRDDKLNEMGALGYKLINILPNGDGYKCIFRKDSVWNDILMSKTKEHLLQAMREGKYDYQLLVSDNRTAIYDATGKNQLYELPPAPTINSKAHAHLFNRGLYPERGASRFTPEELAGVLKYLGYQEVDEILSALS